MIYFTISKGDGGYLIDSVSNDYKALKNKFPDEIIYESDKPIISVYVVKDQLYESPRFK